MLFVYPQFLWAFAAISIPIIIHLFNFRRYKKIYFTNVKYLRELQLESQSKNRLRELLILISRILAISCLVMAFAQPIIGDKQNIQVDKTKIASIYIDNSFSMDGINKHGQLLENAKKIASQVINSFSSNDKFHILTNDFEGKHQRLYSKEDALKEINEIKTSAQVRNFSDVVSKQNSFLSNEKLPAYLYAISDAQKSSFDLPQIKNDTVNHMTLIPLLSSQKNNLYIDSCWFESPLQLFGIPQKLNVRIQNRSDNPVEAGTITLKLNDSQISVSSYSVDSNNETMVSIPFNIKSKGLQYGSLKTNDYPITYDDEILFTFNPNIKINTIAINGKDNQTEDLFNSLLSKDSLFDFKYQNENAIDYSLFANTDLLILNEVSEITTGLSNELIKFCQKGGSLVIIPSKMKEFTSYNSFFNLIHVPQINSYDTINSKLNKPDLKNPFFTGVFEKIDPQLNVPTIYGHYTFQNNIRNNGQTVYELINNKPFLSEYKFAKSLIFVFTSSFAESETNFAKHALFVPTFIRIGIQSVFTLPNYYLLGHDQFIPIHTTISPGESPIHAIGKNPEIDVIPEFRKTNNGQGLFMNNQIKVPGFYNIVRNETVLFNIAYNYDRKESNLDFYETADLQKTIDDNLLTHYKIIDTQDNINIEKELILGASGIKLWKLFIVLTLLFLLFEILIIRFLK